MRALGSEASAWDCHITSAFRTQDGSANNSRKTQKSDSALWQAMLSERWYRAWIIFYSRFHVARRSYLYAQGNVYDARAAEYGGIEIAGGDR